jgi:arabinosaccharide transport system permease protein
VLTIQKKNRLLRSITVIALLLLVVVVLFPLYSLVVASFRSGRELMRLGLTPSFLIPRDIVLDFYKALFYERNGIYLHWFKNSFAISALQTLFTVFFASLVGYGLGVYRFKGRNLIFSLVLFVLMIPIQILVLPLFRIIISFRIIDTYWGVIAPFITSPFVVFFFRQYTIGIPRDFLDAARVDGVSEFGIYLRIMSPLMAPAYAAMAILQARQTWNDFFWPLIVLRSDKKLTLQIGLASLLTPYGSNYDLLLTGAVLATIPIIILFIVFQRYFVSGILAGGLKG